MGIEDLVARLERDADARVAEIEARSKRDVDAIEAKAVAEAARRESDVLGAERGRRRARLDRELAEARRRGREKVLRAQRAIVDRAMARAEELFDAAASDPSYVASIPARLESARRFVSGGAVVRCRPELAPVVERAAAGAEGLTVQTDSSMAMGIAVSSVDGSMDMDDTLRARLARMRDALTIELVREVSDAR